MPVRPLDAPATILSFCCPQKPSQQRQLDWILAYLTQTVRAPIPCPISLISSLTLNIFLYHDSASDSHRSRNATTPNVSNFDRPNRLKGREEGIIRWGELLEKFRAVQERARRLQRMGGGRDADDPAGGDLRIADSSTVEKGPGLEGAGGGPGRVVRGPVPIIKEAPPAKPEPAPKPRSGLGRQFGRLGGAVSGRGKRA